MPHKTRTIIISLVALFVVIIAVTIFVALLPKAQVILSIAPEEFTLTINGDSRGAKTGDVVTVAPGELSITIARDGFESYSTTIDVKSNEKYDLLYTLTPLTNEARKLLETPKSQQIIERIEGRDLNAGSAKLLKEHPILGVLPINDKFFTITSCKSQQNPDDTSKIALCVQLYNLEAQSSALGAIQEAGFNPSDYEIIIINSTYEEQAHEAAGEHDDEDHDH